MLVAIKDTDTNYLTNMFKLDLLKSGIEFNSFSFTPPLPLQDDYMRDFDEAITRLGDNGVLFVNDFSFSSFIYKDKNEIMRYMLNSASNYRKQVVLLTDVVDYDKTPVEFYRSVYFVVENLGNDSFEVTKNRCGKTGTFDIEELLSEWQNTKRWFLNV